TTFGTKLYVAKIECIHTTPSLVQLSSDGDHFLYPQISLSQLKMTFPPSRCPISRLKSRFCISTALVSATAVSAGYLPKTSLSLLYLYEDTPKRAVTLGSLNCLSRRVNLLMTICRASTRYSPTSLRRRFPARFLASSSVFPLRKR